MATRIAVGDAREKLRLIRDESINCCVTSPPYWLKRDYSAGPQEIGREPTIQEYIDSLLLVIDEVYRVLAPHGTFWLNLGDTYLTRNSSELPNKSLCLLPYRVAIAMADRGWIIRNVLVWWKPDCMPESVHDRFTVDYEPLFLCTKGPRYYFKRQVRPYSEKTLTRCKRFIENGEKFTPGRHKCDPGHPVQAPVRVLERISKNLIVPGRSVHSMHLDRANGNSRDVFNADGANMRCVQRISTAGYRGPHFAPFPEDLVSICIDAGCPPGGRVLDPFLGSGTTALVAERLGCDFIGIELNAEYAQQATERILKARAKRLGTKAKPLDEGDKGRVRLERGKVLPMDSAITMSRQWAMPSHETFTIKPIRELLSRYITTSDTVVDPFARNSTVATWTNDLNPQTSARYHMHAADFCNLLSRQGVVADVVLCDPPYSAHQAKLCYQSIGAHLSQREAQVLFAGVKDSLTALLRPNGIAISFGWNSCAFGCRRGYQILEILLVCHGRSHYDTIVVVEQKTSVAELRKPSKLEDAADRADSRGRGANGVRQRRDRTEA